MAKYTTELRSICASLAGMSTQASYDYIDSVIAIARPLIFDFNYPIFDQSHKEELENKILRAYWTDEICAETYGLWHLFLRSKMERIMPRYNELYKTAAIVYNIDRDVDLYEEGGNESESAKSGTVSKTRGESGTESATGSGTDNTTRDTDRSTSGTHSATSQNSDTKNGTSGEVNMYADTPQGAVTGIPGSLSGSGYLTDVREINKTDNATESGTSSDSGTESGTDETDETVQRTTSNTNSVTKQTTGTESGTSSDSGTESGSYNKHTYGLTGGRSIAQNIKEYRENIVNVDEMIIDELADLFMGLW